MPERIPGTQEWKDRLSHTKGSIFPDIERYAKMRMTPQEILLALEIEGRPTYPYEKIENSLNKAWRRGLLPKRTPEERINSRIDVLPQNKGREQERVAYWLKVADEIESGKRLGINPTTRMDWKTLITIRIHEEEELLKRQALATVLPNPNMVPNNPCDVNYLLNFYEARKTFVETGDRSLISKLSKNYTDKELEDIATRLAPQIAAIRDMASRKIQQVYPESVIAIESEPDKR